MSFFELLQNCLIKSVSVIVAVTVIINHRSNQKYVDIFKINIKIRKKL